MKNRSGAIAMSNEGYLGTMKPNFTIISDPDKTLFRLYGVGNSLFGAVWGVIRHMFVYLRSLLLRAGGFISIDESATRAAQQIKFKPAKRDGQPVDFPRLACGLNSVWPTEGERKCVS